MNWKHYSAAFFLGITIYALYAYFLDAPGYMDAEYYFSMGLRIAKYGEFSEPFLWNYLHLVRQVPHPGFTYWMPGPSLLAAAGMLASGFFNFTGAKLAFVILAGLVPVITMLIAFKLSGKNSVAYLAGALALIPVFYAPFFGTTDSFGIMMALGGLFAFVLSGDRKPVQFILLGALSGLMHLNRPDGLVWLGCAILFVLLEKNQNIKRAGLVLAGYLVVMGPWFFRNWLVLGELLPSGTNYVFWMTGYNDLFTLQPQQLSFSNWAQQGWSLIIKNISGALIANLKTFLIVQGQIILAPLILVGFWAVKREKAVSLSILSLVMVFILMTFIFPFAGQRGGFFHSAAACQPVLWTLAAIGFGRMLDFGVKKRSWEYKKANLLFGSALVALLAIATGFVYFNRVIGKDLSSPVWNQSYLAARDIGKILGEVGLEQSDLVMINNPPGLYAASGASSIVIPDGGFDEVLLAAEEFNVTYLVLEANHPDGLRELYQNPRSQNELEFIFSRDGVHYFKFER